MPGGLKNLIMREIVEAIALRDMHWLGNRFLTAGKVYEGYVEDGQFNALDDDGHEMTFIIGLDVQILNK